MQSRAKIPIDIPRPNLKLNIFKRGFIRNTNFVRFYKKLDRNELNKQPRRSHGGVGGVVRVVCGELAVLLHTNWSILIKLSLQQYRSLQWPQQNGFDGLHSSLFKKLPDSSQKGSQMSNKIA